MISKEDKLEIEHQGDILLEADEPSDPDRREALEKLVKYTPPAMVVLLSKDSAWAQISGGPPPPPSDRRLKDDVHYLGKSEGGYPLYRFSYLNDKAKTQFVGVMAQDLVDSFPDVVTTSEDGYYAVYYDRLGLQMTTYEQWLEQGMDSIRYKLHQTNSLYLRLRRE